MKKFLVALMLSLCLITRPVHAKFEMDAVIEQVQLVVQYGKQLTSVSLYISTIQEAIEYIKSMGTLGMNMASELLSGNFGALLEFQDKLHFADSTMFGSFLGENFNQIQQGVNTWKQNVGESVGQLKNEVGSAVQNVQEKVDSAKQKVQETAGAAVQKVKDGANKVKDTISETAGNIKDGIDETVFKKDKSNSAAAKVVVVKSNFGEAQSSKQAAQNFIRSRYFYSFKKGDTYEGTPLTDTSEANTLVRKNRTGYLQEILTIALATAYENSTTVNEESVKRLENLQKQADKAETVDDKKAVEALIVQEEARQRMLKLNLEILMLEKEVVEQLQSLPAGYIIARTADQITADTEALKEEKKK